MPGWLSGCALRNAHAPAAGSGIAQVMALGASGSVQMQCVACPAWRSQAFQHVPEFLLARMELGLRGVGDPRLPGSWSGTGGGRGDLKLEAGLLCSAHTTKSIPPRSLRDSSPLQGSVPTDALFF